MSRVSECAAIEQRLPSQISGPTGSTAKELQRTRNAIVKENARRSASRRRLSTLIKKVQFAPRKREQEALRASHAQHLKTSSQPTVMAPPPTKPRKSARGLASSSEANAPPLRQNPTKRGRACAPDADNLASDHDEDESRRFIDDKPVFAQRVPPARLSCSGLASSSEANAPPLRQNPTKRGRACAPDADNLASDHDEDESRCFIDDKPVFARRVPPARLSCSGCHMEDCIGCACMCEESTVWIDHPDGEGHFFPTCKMCGGTDCPGCACVCTKSTVWVEHGGHSPKKRRVFIC
ncbi:hypothetical protein K438DRAFT_1978850 [Mycena galopus ATCC 62051]|nr:hypothetical protein K438DRAFT_1978850 [Mycena galopus ATCC 62051]